MFPFDPLENIRKPGKSEGNIGNKRVKLINQVGTSLENYEYLLELSVKQLVIQSSPISLGQIICGLCVKN